VIDEMCALLNATAGRRSLQSIAQSLSDEALMFLARKNLSLFPFLQRHPQLFLLSPRQGELSTAILNYVRTVEESGKICLFLCLHSDGSEIIVYRSPLS
jgi:hypothetical protein